MRLSFTLIALALCAPAVAQEPAEDDKVVCKRTDDGTTGSNLKKWTKICRKASEWRAEEKETQRKLRATNDKGLVNSDNLQPAGASPRP